MSSIRNKLADKKSKLAIEPTKDSQHPADLGNGYQDGSFYNVPIDKIRPNPYQPRQFFDPQALAELTESIRQKGIIQPIVIRRDEDGELFLVAGERRLKAAKDAGLEDVPAILTKGNPIEIALIENLQRENLNPIEEAEAFARMIDEFDYTQEQLAKVIGKGRTTVTQTLGLNRLPKEIRQKCLESDIPKRVLVEIARKDTDKEMVELFEKVQSGALTSEDVRQEVRKRVRKPPIKRTPAAIALEKTSLLASYLEKLEIETVEETEKIILFRELDLLKKEIDRFLSE